MCKLSKTLKFRFLYYHENNNNWVQPSRPTCKCGYFITEMDNFTYVFGYKNLLYLIFNSKTCFVWQKKDAGLEQIRIVILFLPSLRRKTLIWSFKQLPSKTKCSLSSLYREVPHPHYRVKRKSAYFCQSKKRRSKTFKTITRK